MPRTMPVRIRRAAKADAAAIARMMKRLRAHHGHPRDAISAAAVRRDGFGAARCYAVLLAEIGGKPAGYVLFQDSYDPAAGARGFYMCDIHVEAAARRRNVGRALMAALAREAKRRKRGFVWWNSAGWNDAARAFYASLGAQDEPVIEHFLAGRKLDALAAEAAGLKTASLPSARPRHRPLARR